MEHAGGTDEDDEQTGDHETPCERTQPGEGQTRERNDSRDRSKDVEAVCLKCRELCEPDGNPVCNSSHGDRSGDEDERQHQPDWQAVRLDAEIDQVTARSVDAGREADHQTHEERQHDRCPTEQVGPSFGAKESDTDAEEAPQQDEVGEVREVHDVGACPTDQDQLDEKHQE